MTVTKEELVILVNNKAGTGWLQYYKSGVVSPTEVVNFGKTIGIVKDINGNIIGSTNYGKIHYANDGLHVVPYLNK